MNHQDWNPVVIHGKTLPSQKVPQSYKSSNVGSNRVGNP